MTSSSIVKTSIALQRLAILGNWRNSFFAWLLNCGEVKKKSRYLYQYFLIPIIYDFLRTFADHSQHVRRTCAPSTEQTQSGSLTCWVETGSCVHCAVCWTRWAPGWDWGWRCDWRRDWRWCRSSCCWEWRWPGRWLCWRCGPSPAADALPAPAAAPAGAASEAVGAVRPTGPSWAGLPPNAAPRTAGTTALEEEQEEEERGQGMRMMIPAGKWQLLNVK